MGPLFLELTTVNTGLEYSDCTDLGNMPVPELGMMSTYSNHMERAGKYIPKKNQCAVTSRTVLKMGTQNSRYLLLPLKLVVSSTNYVLPLPVPLDKSLPSFTEGRCGNNTPEHPLCAKCFTPMHWLKILSHSL